MKMEWSSCKNCKGSEILAYPTFISVSRRHETPGSETKGFITHSTAGSVSFIFKSVLPPTPKPHGGSRKAPVDDEHTVGLVRFYIARV